MQEARKTILLVEDESLIALSEARQLEQAGYAVTTALTGEKATETVRSNPSLIDLVLMDIDLGHGMDGTEAARRILEFADIPILFLSSHMEPEVVSRTEEISSYGYVVKNSSFTVIDASIKMALKLFAAKRQLDLKGAELASANESLRFLAKNLEETNYNLEVTNQKLAFSEEKYEKLFQTNPDYITITDLNDGTFIEVNERFCRVTGYSRQEVLGHSALDSGINLWVYPAERAQLVASLLENEVVMDFEATMRKKDGTYYIASICSRIIEVESRKAFIGVVRDVTGSKKLISDLHESEERFRLITEASSDGVWDYDFLSGRSYYSPSYRDLLGFGRDEALKKDHWADLLDPPDFALVDSALRDCIENRRSEYDIETRVRTRQGAVKWVRARGKVVRRDAAGKATRITGTCVDNTEKKEIEERRDFEHRLNTTLLNNIPDAIYFKDVQGRFIRVNRAHAAKMGFSSPEEAVGKTDFDVFVPESALLSRKDDETVFATGRPLAIPDEKRTWIDGRVSHFSVIKMPHFDEHGRVIGLFGLSRDVTAEKERKDALEKSQQRYYDLLNAIGEGFAAFDGNETFVEANPAAERIFGVGRGELVGRSLYEFLDDEGAGITREQVRNRTSLVTSEFDSPIVRADRQKRWVHVSAQPVSRTAGVYLGSTSVLRDITEEMAAKAALTALVTKKELLMKELQHRVKNTLTLVSSILELAKSEIADERAVSAIEDSQARIVAMSKIYEQLYLTASVEDLDFGFYLKNLANDIFRTYAYLVPHAKLSVNAPSVRLDTKRAISIGLIVNELLTNAIKYAFPSGQDGTIEVSFSLDGPSASLVVADDGVGLDVAAFESSPTIGVSLVRVLVEQLEGTLAIESVKGTKITVGFTV